MPWPVEDIPDEDSLYMRVHQANIRADGSFRTNAWNNHGDGMSTNWSRYSTPEDTRKDVERFGKQPNKYAVIELRVGQVRAIPGQSVQHSPEEDNQAHTDVLGKKDEEARVRLGRIYSLKLSPTPT